MPSVILLVFEGERTEPQVFDSVARHFFPGRTAGILHAVYGAEIYQLWKQVAFDEFLDVVDLLRERDGKQLKGISRSDISEVHLFFDHEGHSHPEVADYDAVISQMLSLFDNETNLGKLYISYPMIEALRDCRRSSGDCLECEQLIADNVHYRRAVHFRSDFHSVAGLLLEDWHYLIAVNALKANRLCHSEYPIAAYLRVTQLTQKLIHEKQVDLFIVPRRSVAVLSAVPFFLLGYFGKTLYDSLPLDRISRYCSFFCLS